MRLVHITTVPQTLEFLGGHVRHLQENGFNVSVISSPEPRLQGFGEKYGVTAVGISMARRPKPIKDIASLWRLIQALRRLKPDIVHSHSPKAGLLGTLAARVVGSPVVVVSVFGLPQMTRSGWSARFLNLLTWISCRLADRVWSDSLSMKEYLIRAGLCEKSKIVVLNHGSVQGVDAEGTFSPCSIPTGTRERIRAELHISSIAIVMGFVGRITADKGMRELALAWRQLRCMYPSLHLMLVGPMESGDPISAEDETLFREDDRIHLLGVREDIPECLSSMDLFVMPSYREGFGMVNIEAAAMALPVISTCIPGCVDSVLDGVTGTLVPPRDPDALCNAIARYLDDPDMARARGLAGRERVLVDFRPEDLESALYDEYMRLQERHNSRRSRLVKRK